MKIAICIKQVPVLALLKFDNETKRVVREGVPNEVNPFDILAVSAVANLKQAMSIEAVVFTMGPPQARDALVQCLAMGMDRAVHLVDRAYAGSDTLATARALSMALRQEEFDLIICGRNSVDAETAQVGPEIAEFLGLPQVTGVRRLELSDSGKSMSIERTTDDGYEVIYCSLPALITVTEGVAPEAFPRKEAIEAAQSKPIAELTAADLSDDTSLFGLDGSPTWVNDIYSIESNREGIVVRDVPVDDAVSQLMDYLDKRRVFSQQEASAITGNPRGPRREPGSMGAIWVLAELLGGEIRPVTLELLGRASELASQIHTDVEAVILGDSIEGHAKSLAAHGADTVRIGEDSRLAQYDTENYTAILAEAIATHSPYAVLIPSTINGRDLAARLAARLKLGLTGDCVGLEIDDEGRLVQLKPAFGGSIIAPILSRTMPQMATVRPGLLTQALPDWSIEPKTRALSLDSMVEPRVRVLESVKDGSTEGADLEHARIIVSVGKGVGAPENISIVRELAQALNASLGATREVTDLGWLPRQHQIGLSGKSVSPELYIAVALRGPFNHTVGIQKAGTVIAINNRARSPIFGAADFGIVGDYAELVPALTSAIRNRNASRSI